jgi:hypothetical protein
MKKFKNNSEAPAEMGTSRATHAEKWNTCRVLKGKPEEKEVRGRPRRRWDNTIKMDLRERTWSGTD